MKRITPIIFLLFLSLTSLAFQDSILMQNSRLSGLASFIDSTMESEMIEYNVPGSVIAIVHDSTESYYKGYGLADLENGKTVDAQRTGFRVASITKTFTATAAMQLVDLGKLNLNVDIANYLPEYEYSFLKKGPVTMHHLLTHTAGFVMTDINDAARTADDILTIEEVVKNHMPEQAYAPGEVYCYSNFGYTLAGYVIEVVSGISYTQFVGDNILKPLQMNFSGLDQPLQNPVLNNEASSYLWAGKQIKYSRDYTNVVPADVLVTTGKDMSAYMSFLLNSGIYNDNQILSENAFRLMTTQQYGGRGTNYGICYAFREGQWTGRRTLEHSGGQLGFASVMIIIPETGTGIFIAHNSREGANRFRYDVIHEVLNVLIGNKERSLNSVNIEYDQENPLHNYCGLYRQVDYPKGSFEKLSLFFGIMGSEWDVKTVKDTLIIVGNKFLPLGDHVFQSIENSEWTVSFDIDENNRVFRLTSGLTSYDKIPIYKRKRILQVSLAMGLFILLIMFITRPIKWIGSIVNKKTTTNYRDWIYEWMYFTGSAFIISFIVILINFAIYQDQLTDYGIPFSIKSSLTLNYIAGISSLFTPVALWKMCTSSHYNMRRKIFYILGIIGVAITSILYLFFNMMGW